MTTLLAGAATEGLAASPHVPAVLIAVMGPEGQCWRVALGRTGEQLPSNAVTRTASVTKTVTAATAAALQRAGVLNLHAPVVDLLPPPFAAALRRSTGHASGLTMAELLQHTSGLPDYATDERWIGQVLGQPQRVWSPLELASWCAENGVAAGTPGFYRYSDTGYVFAAAVLEQVAGAALPVLYRRVLDVLDDPATTTWLEGRELPVPHVRAPLGVLGGDGWALSPSADNAGGGGLVSDMSSMARWFRAAVDVLEPWRGPLVEAGDDGLAGLGVFAVPTRWGTAWRHDGALGSFAVRLPEIGVTVAASVCALHPEFFQTQPKRALWEALEPALDRLGA
jgi:D-alanyl-D-alanine carboxypeptidase